MIDLTGSPAALVLTLGGLLAVSNACDQPLSLEERVATIEITTAPPVLETGSGVQLSFEARDAAGNVVALGDAEVQFSSSFVAIATVSETGFVTSVGPGTAVIGIVVGSAAASIAVTVVPEISSLDILPARLDLLRGETRDLDMTVLDAGGRPVAGPVLTFTSLQVHVASVDDRGRVTARSPGSATITVEGGGESDSIEVIVFAPLTGDFGSLLAHSFTVQAGDEIPLTDRPIPFIFMFDGDGVPVPGAELEFASTDAGIAAVEAPGILVARAPGEALITVTGPPGRGSATMRVKVLEAGSVDVFEMRPEGEATISPDFEGGYFPLFLELDVRVDGLPIRDFLPWFSSSDESVAVAGPTVLHFSPEPPQAIGGVVHARSPGTAVITVGTGDHTAEVVVTVPEL